MENLQEIIKKSNEIPFERKNIMDNKIKEKILELKELVWLEDIPSPTVPEYVEHHQSIKKILKFIDEEILGKE
jgi:phosphomevalonate kinase